VGSEAILVVDDNRQLANFVANTLLTSLGYQTRLVYDGKSALQYLRANHVDLMLLDLEMPDMSGLELLRQLAHENLSVPTILVTAHGSEQVAADAFRLGVHDYLTKPVDAETLDQAISAALSESRLRQEKILLTSQLRAQVEWLNALTKIGQSLTATLDLDDLLRRIVEAGVEITRAEGGFLALLEPKSSQLYLCAVKNIDEQQIRTLRQPVKDSLLGKVISTRRAIFINNQPSDPLKITSGFLVRSLIHVPILFKGHLLGVLSVHNQMNVRSFSAEDQIMLTSLADFAAIALENANLYQQAQREITERKHAEEALRVSEERYALAVQGANDGIWDWDLKNNLVHYSLRWKAMLGFREEEIGSSPMEWLSRVHPEDLARVKQALSNHLSGITTHFENEHRIRTKSGAYIWVLNRGLAVQAKQGKANRIAGSITDISERKVFEAQLEHNAFYDKLTGLPNRAFFIDHLRSVIERIHEQENFLFAVLFLDLDGFKDINDSLGHPVGDQLLIAVAQLLHFNLRSTDIVARLGGDEFVILLDNLRNPADAALVANTILNKLSTPITLESNTAFVTTSIGLVLGSSSYKHPEEILRDADIAMYEAKALGKATYQIFAPEMRERIKKRISMETDLRQALQRNELLVFYQPIVCLKTGQIEGFEALVRWKHPETGLLSAGEFIPIAHEAGLLSAIDRWVLDNCCQQMRSWKTRFPNLKDVKLNVNFAPRLASQSDLVAIVLETVKKTGLTMHDLRLEFPENAVAHNLDDMSKNIDDLKQLGIEIQIDDFGTGYAPLIYLQKINASGLKIDRAFTEKIDDNHKTKEMIRSMVDLAHELNMKAFAEGIETASQLSYLSSLNCDYGQGYFFYAPLDVEAVEALLCKTHTQEAQLGLGTPSLVP
jgi:diguanylate cyclase (GGDEF)-like protein/PAS domain S-box-containing protein